MISAPKNPTDDQSDKVELSLEEMFARDAERLKLTPDKVREMTLAFGQVVRKHVLADFGLTEHTLDIASDDIKSAFTSKLMDEEIHSTGGRILRGFYDAARAREARLIVEARADAILGSRLN